MARSSRVEFTTLDIIAEGIVDRRDGVTRFTEIMLRPRISIPVGIDRERMLAAVHKSDRGHAHQGA